MVEMVFTELVEAIAFAGLERWSRHPKLSDAGKIRRALQVSALHQRIVPHDPLPGGGCRPELRHSRLTTHVLRVFLWVFLRCFDESARGQSSGFPGHCPVTVANQ